MAQKQTRNKNKFRLTRKEDKDGKVRETATQSSDDITL